MRDSARALLIALTVVVLMPIHGAAMAPIRLAIAADGARLAGTAVSGDDPDVTMITTILARHGVAVSARHSALTVVGGATLLDVGASPPLGPVPGDVVTYQDAIATTGPLGGTDLRTRLGLYVGSDRLLVFDTAHGVMRIARRAVVEGVGTTVADGPPLGTPGTLHAYRLAAALWPGGHDDVAVAPGRIEIADAGTVLDDLGWSNAHPRDADPSLGHALAVTLITVITPFVVLIAVAIEAVGRVIGLVGGMSVDGRGVHAVLSVAVVVVAGLLMPWLGAVLLATVAVNGVSRVAEWRGVTAFTGAVIGATGWAAGAAVTLITGLDGDRSTPLAVVAMSVVCAPLRLARDLWAALRGGRFIYSVIGVAPRLTVRGLAWGPVIGRAGIALARLRENGLFVGRLGDLLALRPGAWREAVLNVRAGRSPFRGDVALELRPPHVDLRHLGVRALDVVSWVWRPHAIATDLLGHATDAAVTADLSLRSGLHGVPFEPLRRAVIAMAPPLRERVLRVAAAASVHGVPALRDVLAMTHAHAAGETVANICNGVPPGPDFPGVASGPGVAHVGGHRVPPVAPPRPQPPAIPAQTSASPGTAPPRSPAVVPPRRVTSGIRPGRAW